MTQLTLVTTLALLSGLAHSAAAHATSDPVPFALEHADSWWTGAESRTIQAMKSSPEDLTNAQVVITDDNILDDSVRAARVTLNLVMGENDSWQISQRIEEYRCQPGRGQQKFQPKRCR